MEEYDIYIRGFASGGPEPPELGLHRVFGLDTRRARELVDSLPRVVKRHVPAGHVRRYERALGELGADFELRLSPIRPQQIIAVRGAEPDELDRVAQQHGSTLTLPPPKLAEAAIGARSPRAGTVLGHAPGAPASARERVGAPAAGDRADTGDTVVDPTPAGGLAGVQQSAAQPPSSFEHAPPAVPAPALPAQPRPSAATLPEAVHVGVPPVGAAPRAAPVHARAPAAHARAARDLPLERLAHEQAVGWGAVPALEPAAAPRSARRPAAAPSARAQPAPSAAPRRAAAWADAIEPQPAPPQPRRALEPNAVVLAGDDGELPPASAVPGLQLDGRPDWLVEGPRALQPEALEQPALRPSEAAPQTSAPPPRARAQPSARARALPANVRAPTAGGVVVGRELPAGDPSAWLRWSLRLGMGIAFFIILTTVRHCRMFDREVQKALARWETPPASGGSPSGVAAAADWAGPVASEWMESDLHQFTNGDKDRVQDLVRRLLRAGARQVRVGHIMRSGVVQIGGELIVELPEDSDKRKAVLAEYDRFQQGTFGGMAAPAKDPSGNVLRVAL